MRKDLRLRQSELFAQAYKEGKSIPSKQVVLYYLDRGLGERTRAGFSISKKVGNAVTRNKTKRRLKSILESVADDLRDGYILVFVGRPAIAERSFIELKEAVYRLLKQADVLRDDQ